MTPQAPIRIKELEKEAMMSTTRHVFSFTRDEVLVLIRVIEIQNKALTKVKNWQWSSEEVNTMKFIARDAFAEAAKILEGK